MPRPSLSSSVRKRKATGEEDSLAAIKTLETELTRAVPANGSLNPLADLLDTAQTNPDVSCCSKAVYALYRVFVLIIAHGLLLGHDSHSDDAQAAVHSWLVEKFDAYVALLSGLLSDEDSTLKTCALQILFSLQKHLSTALSSSRVSSSSSTRQPHFHVSHFRKIVNALLTCPPSHRTLLLSKKRRLAEHSATLDPDVRDLFIDTWLSVYDDVRWFFLREAAGLLTNPSRNVQLHAVSNLLSILERMTTFPTESSELNAWWVEELGSRPQSSKPSDLQGRPEGASDPPETSSDWREFFEDDDDASDVVRDKRSTARLYTLSVHQSLHSLASHKAVFTRTWLALLPVLSSGSLSFSKALSLRVLNILHRRVIPHLTKAILIMDWVGSCVDYGATVGLLALNALFALMKEYNLDYPSFFTRLYTFLNRDLLHLKHRARFFRLTEMFLSSTHLPATLLASFIKRLSRMSLNAPPAAIVLIIPFTYNILRRHPSLMVMIHRPGNVRSPEHDPFQMRQSDPTLTNALDSSLWELHSHVRHYHAVVSTLAGIFQEAFTRPSYAMEDFLDHTYATLYDSEVKRKVQEQAVAADPHKRVDGDVVDGLWTLVH